MADLTGHIGSAADSAAGKVLIGRSRRPQRWTLADPRVAPVRRHAYRQSADDLEPVREPAHRALSRRSPSVSALRALPVTRNAPRTCRTALTGQAAAAGVTGGLIRSLLGAVTSGECDRCLVRLDGFGTGPGGSTRGTAFATGDCSRSICAGEQYAFHRVARRRRRGPVGPHGSAAQ